MYLVWPFRLRDIIDIFKNIHIQKEKKSPEDIALLIDILNNTEYFITDTRIFDRAPCSENDVHMRIEGLLKCSFPDVERKFRLPKHIKRFEPDNGIPSLRTLIEYKYIDNLDDGKRIIEEILADIGGYQSEDYDNFIFVIYETHRLIPLSEWTKAIEESKPHNHIEVVLLKGERPPKVEGIG